jgi:aspartate/methionine/tyrosine aminotransferase
MVELFDWEEQEAEINLSWSSVEGYLNLDMLEYDERDPIDILAEWYGVDPENVVLVHGAQEGTFLSLLALKPEVIHVPRPNYPLIWEQAMELGIRVEYTGLYPDVEDSVVVLANPNNPTGKYLELDEVAEKNIVVVDEIFRPYVTDEPWVHENAVVICSTSKFFGFKDRKVGWIIAGRRFAKRIKHIRDLVTPTPISDAILVKYAYRNYDYIRRRTLEIVGRNREILYRLNKYFEIGYSPHMPIALLLKDGLDSMGFAEKLYREKDVLLNPLRYWGVDGGLRISLGKLDTGLLEEGMRRINEFIEEHGF